MSLITAQRPDADVGRRFAIHSEFAPAGDQPRGDRGARRRHRAPGERDQVLLGVTGSGKTFTMAHVIARDAAPGARSWRPTRRWRRSFTARCKSFFPDNAVEYFVSYYDYYQPEAYVPRTDTYIEKESSINEQIDRMRHSATRAILERRDIVIVASVSCIYGIGSVETYSEMTMTLATGPHARPRRRCWRSWSSCNTGATTPISSAAPSARAATRSRSFPAHYEDRAWRLSLFGDELEAIHEFDPLTGEKTAALDEIKIYPNRHYVTPKPTLHQAIEEIKRDLKLRLAEFNAAGKLLEAQRLEQRTQFDIEMIAATGSCAGIENYSRYLTGRAPGEPPPTLFEYLPKDALVFVDESHVTIPQLGGMYKGDYARKFDLAGLWLPPALVHRQPAR